MVRHFPWFLSLALSLSAPALAAPGLPAAHIGTPAPVAEGLDLLQAGRARSAASHLAALLSSGDWPEHDSEIRYHLGRSLLEMDLPLSAQVPLFTVAKRGPDDPYFGYALAKLVVISEQVGDSRDLRRLAGSIDPAAVPAAARSAVGYHHARARYDGGELGAALDALEFVDPASPESGPARLLAGTIYAEQEKLKSAVRAFRDTYKDDSADPAVRDLALVNIARTYYRIERYDEAVTYYGLVERDSAMWSTALFERSWARFMLDEHPRARGDLMTVSSPFFAEHHFVPERELLGALMDYSRCAFATTVSEVEAFSAKYTPVQAELRTLLVEHGAEGGAHAELAWRHYFGSGAEVETDLPDAFFAGALRNQALAGTVRHLRALDAEQALIAEQRSDWQAQLGARLSADLEGRRVVLERRAGRLLLTEAGRVSLQLDSLLANADLLKFDALTGAYDQLVGQAEDLPVPVVERGLRYLYFDHRILIEEPFNGEFWEDELGYYIDRRPGFCE